MPYYTGVFGKKSNESLQGQVLTGEVVQVFEHTVNIVLKKQFPNLLTIGGMQVVGSPQSIAFEDFSEIQRQLQIGDSCVLYGGRQLIFPQLTCWLEGIPEFSLGEEIILPSVEVLSQRKKQIAAVLAQRNQHQSQPSLAPFYQQLQKEISQLQEGLLQESWFEVEKQVARMVGLGIGLTPSGDDMLTGMLLVLFDDRPFKSRVLEASKQTNLISQHQLYFASQGFAKPSVLRVIQEIFSCQLHFDVLEKAIEETLMIGSTSGHDLLSGIVAGLEVLERKGEEKYEFSRKNHSQSLH